VILHALDLGEPRGQPPLVLLHGLLGAARNFGTLQRRLAATRRVVALDLRNHGASPHAAGMDYATMAADVGETLGALGALPAAMMGHSMGGKVAMRLALDTPAAVERLLVSDIAPVAYPDSHGRLVQALLRVPLTPGLTRAQAEAAIADAVPEPEIRAFLLQNLRLGAGADAVPAWRVGLAEIAAALPDITGWRDSAGERPYAGRALFVAGERSGYIRAEDRAAIRARFPQARFVTVKQAGHWVHADNPAGFAAVLDAFLAA
jgi:pimeloyl-ACP methyl ester carboxylesterase